MLDGQNINIIFEDVLEDLLAKMFLPHYKWFHLDIVKLDMPHNNTFPLVYQSMPECDLRGPMKYNDKTKHNKTNPQSKTAVKKGSFVGSEHK